MLNLKFLLDENIPLSVKNFLEAKKFKAGYAQKGISDAELYSLAKKRKEIIVSRDSDFLYAFSSPSEKHYGIVVFVIHPPEAKKIVSAMAALLSEVKDFEGKIFVIDEQGFKVSGK